MTLSSLLVPLGPSLLSVLGAAPVADYRVSVQVPDLFVEGHPFVVEVSVTGTGTKAAEVPTWLLTAAAWDVDTKALARRTSEGTLVVAPGQTVSTSLDLRAGIDTVLDDDKRDFRLRYTGSSSEATEVIHLAIPESGLDFEALPREQLSDYHVVLQTSGGPIWLELWPDVAPNHVRNFLDLCSTGFYDGSPFHRVIPNFMIQGGRAKDGTQPPRKLNQEFSTRRHGAGVLSAARLDGDENSATSEFFITHRPNPQLDGKYTAFGQVIHGMDSVEAIVEKVESHYALVNALNRNGHRIDPSEDAVARAINKPNPPQVVLQALIVKATKSRPVEPR